MTRTMYDDIYTDYIPRDAEMVAGYVGGAWPTFTGGVWDGVNHLSLSEIFPNAVCVSIAVASRFDADVLDIENGDATPAVAPGWAKRQRSLGKDPTAYCSTYLWPQVKAAFWAAREPLPHWWEAHYDGIPSISAEAVAKQYHNGHPDISIVADNAPWIPKPVPVPTPVPTPTPQPEWSIPVQNLDLRNADHTPVRGPSVKALQTLLILAGSQIKADGNAGPLTKAALGLFQLGHGLGRDYVAGPATWGSLCKQ